MVNQMYKLNIVQSLIRYFYNDTSGGKIKFKVVSRLNVVSPKDIEHFHLKVVLSNANGVTTNSVQLTELNMKHFKKLLYTHNLKITLSE